MMGLSAIWQESKEISIEWILGLTFGILATLFGTLSKILWRKCHTIMAQVEDYHDQTPEYKAAKRSAGCSWWTGFLLLVLNPPADVLAFALAPQSVVSATSGSASMFNLMFAPWLVGEKATWVDIIGAILVSIGCAGVGVFGPKATPVYTLPEIEGMFLGSEFILFMLCQAAFLALCVSLISFPVSITGKSPKKLAWGAISGTLGGNYFFVKAWTSLMGYEGMWKQPTFWVLGAGAIGVAVFSVILLNEGLRRYTAIFVAPVFQAFLVVSGAISGAVFFQELVDMPDDDIMGFWVSLFIITAGVCFCMLKGEDSEKGDDDSYIAAEEIEKEEEDDLVHRQFQNEILGELEAGPQSERKPLLVRDVW